MRLNVTFDTHLHTRQTLSSPLSLVLLNNLDHARVKITQGNSRVRTRHTHVDIPEELFPAWVCLVLLCQLTEYGFDLLF